MSTVKYRIMYRHHWIQYLSHCNAWPLWVCNYINPLYTITKKGPLLLPILIDIGMGKYKTNSSFKIIINNIGFNLIYRYNTRSTNISYIIFSTVVYGIINVLVNIHQQFYITAPDSPMYYNILYDARYSNTFYIPILFLVEIHKHILILVQ